MPAVLNVAPEHQDLGHAGGALLGHAVNPALSLLDPLPGIAFHATGNDPIGSAHMSRIGLLRRRMMLAYALTCAREQMHNLQLRVPTGVWFCERCQLFLWDLETFTVHDRLHVA